MISAVSSMSFPQPIINLDSPTVEEFMIGGEITGFKVLK